MNLSALEIPDDDVQLADWLERQIVGMDLGNLVAQLAIGRGQNAELSIDAALGGQLPRVLASGLVALSADELRGLLEQPHLLLQLQDRLFVEGGDYWRGVPRTMQHLDAIRQVDEAVERRLAEPTRTNTASPSSTSRRMLWGAVLAIAATLLVAIGFWTLRPAPTPGWGFDRRGILTTAMPGDEYLSMLAKAGGDWFNKTPDSPAALRLRLEQFRQGCDTLLAAPHPQLAETDKVWLLDKCRLWRDGIDRRLSELDASSIDFTEVRKRADTRSVPAE